MYDLTSFNLPAKQQQAPQSGSSKSSAPDSAPLTGSKGGNDSPGYDLGKFDLPKLGQPAKASTGTGYDLSKFGLPENAALPLYGGKGAEETICLRDWGGHVKREVNQAWNHSPQQAFNAFYHSIGTAEGLGFLSGPTLTKLKELGGQLIAAKNPRLFFDTHVVSVLNGLRTSKKGGK